MFGFFQKTTRLAELTGDVDMVSTPPTNGQVPVYESSSGKWKPGSGGGGGTSQKTPDGLTEVSRADRYNVRDYGASGLDTIWRGTSNTSGGTTTVTTTNGSGTPVAHDFIAGNGVMILRAGAASSLATPDETKGSVTVVGTSGATTYQFKVIGIDGYGGYTAASGNIQTTTGNATLNLTNYLTLKLPIPYGAVSIGLYLAGKLISIIDVTQRFVAASGNAIYGTFSLAETSGGSGVAILTVASGHGMTTGDVIHLRAQSSGDSAYDGAYVIASTTATTITLGAATYLGSGNATGQWQPGFIKINYNGATPPLHESKGMPDTELPTWDWTANIVQPRGNYVVDNAHDWLWRSVELLSNDRKTGSSEPGWDQSVTSRFTDGDHIRRRAIDCIPGAAPSSAGRQALLTTIATVPTTSTFTTTDAASGDISDYTLALIAHNDALALRAAVAAALASGRGGVIWVDGVHEVYLPKQTNTNYWTHVSASDAAADYAFLSLRSGTQSKPRPAISIELAPDAVIRGHYMQCGGAMEDMDTADTSRATLNFIHFGGDGITIRGGAWEWNVYSGGIAEHFSSDNSFSQYGAWGFDQGNSSAQNLGTPPQDTYIENTRIDWPSIWISGGVTSDDAFSFRRLWMRGVKLHYGGGDGDQTFSTNFGEFYFVGGEIQNTRRLGSHGIYLGVNRRRHTLRDIWFKDITTSNSYAIQARGSSGDGYVLDSVISGCFFTPNCNAVTIGDQTSGNQVHNLSMTDCHGAGVVLAECRRVQIRGGSYRYVQITEDCEDIEIAGFTADYFDIQPSDQGRNIFLDKLVARQYFAAKNLSESNFTNFTVIDAHRKDTNLTSYLYEWIATGSNNEYYVRNRATGGDPGISSPAAVRVRERVTNIAGTLGSLTGDSWYYGDPGGLGYSTVVVKIADDHRYDPDANPYGSVWTCTLLNIGSLYLTGTLENCTFRDGVLQSNWTNIYTSFVGLPGGGATCPNMLNVLFENILTEAAGLTANANGTMRMWDFSTTGPTRCERVVWRNCKWYHPLRPATEVMTDVRMDFTNGGDITFEGCDLTCWGTGPEFSNAYGNVNVINCRIQTNEAYYSCATSDVITQTLERNTVGLIDTADSSQPVVIEKRGYTLPVSSPQLAVGTVYWYRGSTGKLYATKAAADSAGTAIDITTANGPILLRFLNATLPTIRATHKYLGDTTYPNAYRTMRGNLWRGSPVATYAQITADQNQYTLIPLLNEHRLSSDASRNINGIRQNGMSLSNREDTLYNVGAQNIVLVEASGSAAAADQMNLPGAANFTIAAGHAATLFYDGHGQTRRMKSNTA